MTNYLIHRPQAGGGQHRRACLLVLLVLVANPMAVATKTKAATTLGDASKGDDDRYLRANSGVPRMEEHKENVHVVPGSETTTASTGATGTTDMDQDDSVAEVNDLIKGTTDVGVDRSLNDCLEMGHHCTQQDDCCSKTCEHGLCVPEARQRQRTTDGNGNKNGNSPPSGNGPKKIRAIGRGNNGKVHIDTTELGQRFITDPRIEVQLVPNGKFTGFDRMPGGHMESWFGTASDGSTISLMARKAKGLPNDNIPKGIVVGSIVSYKERMVYQIKPNAEGDEVIVATPSGDFPDEGEPRTPEAGPGDTEDRLLLIHEEKAKREEVTGSETDNSDTIESDGYVRASASSSHHHRKLISENFIDVMVLWTSNAECRNSDLPRGCARTSQTEANMRAMINLAVAETNIAYTQSGVNTLLRLVYAYHEPQYSEASTDAFDHALNFVGADLSISDERTAYGADAVSVIIDDPEWCGLGYLGPRQDLMFSVTAWNCATGYYSFGHEIGHNLGCHHDRGTASACASTGYHYGYRDPAARFRSIMAYNCVNGQCDNNPGGGCTRVIRFSNNDPNNGWDGNLIGNDSNNCARRINDVLADVSNYFPSSTECSVANPSYIGDGYCDNSGGYNSAICAWDGGDCCEDTCTDGIYACGVNGYDCKISPPTNPPVNPPTNPPGKPPTKPPLKPPKSSGMSGSTGVTKILPDEAEITTVVKDLKVGDQIRGLDEAKQLTTCTVEAIGTFGHGPLFGNYTSDHFVLDYLTGNVHEHGTVGERTVEEKYEVLTSCPVGMDESGKGFTPIDSDFCGAGSMEVSWSDYLRLHSAILSVVQASGGYWFSGSTYASMDTVQKFAPNVCKTMLKCAKDHKTCNAFEAASSLFVKKALTESARIKTEKAFNKIGSWTEKGSVSAAVSRGKSVLNNGK